MASEPPKEKKKRKARRIDPNDGQPYTKKEFIAEYGGTDEWDKAEKYKPKKSSKRQKSGGAAGDEGAKSDPEPVEKQPEAEAEPDRVPDPDPEPEPAPEPKPEAQSQAPEPKPDVASEPEESASNKKEKKKKKKNKKSKNKKEPEPEEAPQPEEEEDNDPADVPVGEGEFQLLKEGWVFKQGDINTNAKRRWLKLYGNYMLYFKDDTITNQSGAIRLKGAVLTSEELQDFRWHFQVQPTNAKSFSGKPRTYRFAVDSKKEFNRWFTLIEQAIANAQEGDPPNEVVERKLQFQARSRQQKLAEVAGGTSQTRSGSERSYTASRTSTVNEKMAKYKKKKKKKGYSDDESDGEEPKIVEPVEYTGESTFRLPTVLRIHDESRKLGEVRIHKRNRVQPSLKRAYYSEQWAQIDDPTSPTIRDRASNVLGSMLSQHGDGWNYDFQHSRVQYNQKTLKARLRTGADSTTITSTSHKKVAEINRRGSQVTREEAEIEADSYVEEITSALDTSNIRQDPSAAPDGSKLLDQWINEDMVGSELTQQEEKYLKRGLVELTKSGVSAGLLVAGLMDDATIAPALQALEELEPDEEVDEQAEWITGLDPGFAKGDRISGHAYLNDESRFMKEMEDQRRLDAVSPIEEHKPIGAVTGLRESEELSHALHVISMLEFDPTYLDDYDTLAAKQVAMRQGKQKEDKANIVVKAAPTRKIKQINSTKDFEVEYRKTVTNARKPPMHNTNYVKSLLERPSDPSSIPIMSLEELNQMKYEAVSAENDPFQNKKRPEEKYVEYDSEEEEDPAPRRAPAARKGNGNNRGLPKNSRGQPIKSALKSSPRARTVQDDSDHEHVTINTLADQKQDEDDCSIM